MSFESPERVLLEYVGVKRSLSSMLEMPYAREYHRYAVLVALFYALLVPYAPAGLDYGGDAGLGR